jgi:hypothetical protein
MKMLLAFNLLVLAACNSQSKNVTVYRIIGSDTAAIYELCNGKLIAATYLDSLGERSSTFRYTYNTENSSIIAVDFSGDSSLTGADTAFERMRQSENLGSINLMQSKFQLTLPYSCIAEIGIRDMLLVLSSADKFEAIETRGNRTISVFNIDKSFRFYPSLLETYIAPNVILHQYQLEEQAGVIKSDKFTLADKVVERYFIWKHENELTVKIIVRTLDGITLSEDKTVYLGQKSR